MMMRQFLRIVWCTAAVLLLALPPVAAQRTQRFKAALLAGMTASQIDGDESAGYKKVGIQAGLRGIVMLKPRQQASVEILYTQRGARNEPVTPPFFNITLNYIEVPLQWHYQDWGVYGLGSDDPLFYRVRFNVGASYGRLLGYQETQNESGIRAALPFLRRNSICGLVGATFFANEHLGFTFRYHRAVNLLYRAGRSAGNYQYSLNEHFLALQAGWFF